MIRNGLNKQALDIEEAQSKIKVLLRDMILAKASLRAINSAVLVAVKKCVDKMSKEIQAKVEQGLLQFAGRVYAILKDTYKDLGMDEVVALAMLANGNITEKYTKKVQEVVKKEMGAYQWGLPLDIYAKNYMEVVSERIDLLAKVEAKEDYSSRLTLRNLAEIQVRQEAHEDELAEYGAKGVNLIWIVPHSNCSERCQPWQDKLYSLDHTYGEIDGIKYQPLENATDIYQTTKKGTIYKNGCLSGFNCRHTTKGYEKGNKPVAINSAEIEKAREIDAKQRYYERGIRAWRDKALLFKDIDTKRYAFAKNKAKQWNEKYVEYSQKNGVSFYPSRTQII